MKRCGIYKSIDRPEACANLTLEQEMSGNSPEEALEYLAALEAATKPELEGVTV